MRKCLRCQKEMIEDLELITSNGSFGIVVKEKGLFKGSLGKTKCAVCPICGYVETYIDDLDKIKELVNNKEG